MPPYRDDRAGPRVSLRFPARGAPAGSTRGTGNRKGLRMREAFRCCALGRRSGASEGEAVAAVDGLAARRAEGDRCLLAATRAGCREHLAGTARIPATTAVAKTGTASVAAAAGVAAGRLAACTTGRATARLRE